MDVEETDKIMRKLLDISNDLYARLRKEKTRSRRLRRKAAGLLKELEELKGEKTQQSAI
tara:strand:+ start:305 stop:481 length:177 start_codon:yes stop_codon:yes gene_type:complete